MNQAFTDYTNDLVVQRNQIQSDIQNFEKLISEKKAVLLVLDNLFKQAQQRAIEQEATKKKTTVASVDISSIPIALNPMHDLAAKITQFLLSQP